jgi:integrase
MANTKKAKNKKKADRKGWSLQKRGNVYFIYHRYNLENKLVGKSTGSTDWEEATEIGLHMARELRTDLKTQQGGEYYAAHIQADKKREEEEELMLGKEKDKVNPRISVLWTIPKRSEGGKETGVLFELIKREQSYANLAKFRSAWRFITETLPEIQRVGEITPTHMDKVMAAKKKNVSELTLAQYWGIAYRTLFRILIEQGWYHKENPAPKFKMSSKRTKKIEKVQTISDEQIKKLFPIFEAFDPAFGMFFKLGLHTGMRRTEIANLRWEDVDLDNKPRAILTVRPHDENEKNGVKRSTIKTKNSHRVVPLQKELTEYLTPRRKDTGYVVESDVYSICREQFQLPKKLVAQAQAEEVCKGFHTHMFRHTFITAALTAVDPKTKLPLNTPVAVAKWVGDTVQMILDTYVHTLVNDNIDFKIGG